MTQFVGINPDDVLTPDGYYRVVIERLGATLFLIFRSQANAVYSQMFARTGALVPTSPNPVIQNHDDTAYVIDTQLINTDTGTTLTAANAVALIEAIAGGTFLDARGYGVREFIAVSDVSNGPAERYSLLAEVETQKQGEGVGTTINHYVTLGVIAIVALAVIQVSKDL